MQNYSITDLILEAYQEKVEEKNTRDIRKILQFVGEGYAYGIFCNEGRRFFWWGRSALKKGEVGIIP